MAKEGDMAFLTPL